MSDYYKHRMILERRADWLRSRLSDRSHAYDVTELGALEWALRVLHDVFEGV